MADAEVAEDSGAPGLVAPLLPPPDPASATSFLINPAHTNSVANATFSPPLARLWSADLDGAPSYPLIADGRVFVGVSGQVLALDQTTGEKLWSADLAQGFFGHAYEAGRLFTVDASGVVTAFSAATGQVEWTRSVIGPFFTSSTVIPTAYRGIVYVTAPSTPTVYLNSDTVAVTVFGFDEATGTTVLRQSEMFSDSTAPAVTDNGIVIGYDAAIANYDYLSGELLWSLNYNTDSSDIVVNGSYVYASELGYATGTDVSLDIATGNSAGAFAATVAPAFDGSLGFFVFGDQLSAVDLSSGLTRWTALGPVGDDFLLPPLVAGGYVYLVDDDGNLLALDEMTGAAVWSDPGVDPPPAAPPGTRLLGPQPLGASGGILVVPEATTLVAYTSAADAGPGPDAAPVEAGEGAYDAGTSMCAGGQPVRACVEYAVLLNWLDQGGDQSELEIPCQSTLIPQTPADFASIQALCETNFQRVLEEACQGCSPGSCGPCP